MFYGWRVVAGALVSQLFVIGFFTYAASLLVGPVREEFGASLEQVMYGLTVGTVVGLIITPVAGIMIDRYPVRWLMAGGSVIFSAGLWGIAHSQSITQYIVLFGLTMSLANSFAGSMPATAVVSRWFTVSRGRALGIAALGTSVGGVIIPALLSRWLGEHGWRGSMEQLSLWSLILMLPVIIVTVRGKPSDVGMAAEADGSTGAADASAAPTMSLKDILRSPGYWYLGLSLGILFGAYSAILANLSPYAINLGHSEERASSLIMTIAIAGFIGKLMFGAAADRFSLKAGLCTAQGLVILGFLLLALEPDFTLVLVASGVMGLAAGGMLPVWAAMMVQIFGLLSYGRAMGLMSPLLTLCIMPSFALVGRLYDMSGSFTLGLLIYSGAMFIGILLLIPLKLHRS
jgi:MFS family permease